MAEGPKFSFSAKITDAWVEGRIERQDGVSITINGGELLVLMADLAAGGLELPSRARHIHRVLEEWFARKTAKPHLRAVS